jgi:hypothetical protein
MFTVWVKGCRYDCPVPRAMLYELSRTQDPGMDRIEAYLDLKEKIRVIVEQMLTEAVPGDGPYLH